MWYKEQFSIMEPKDVVEIKATKAGEAQLGRLLSAMPVCTLSRKWRSFEGFRVQNHHDFILCVPETSAASVQL